MYVNLALPLPIRKLFTYKIPEVLEKNIGPGFRVLVQLGSRFLIGVAVEVNVSAVEFKTKQIKEVLSILEPYPFFSKSLLDLTKWMSEYYFASWGECLKSALPQYPDVYRKVRIEIAHPINETESLSPKAKQLWEKIKDKKELKVVGLSKQLKTKDIYQQLQYLQEKGWIKLKLKLSETPNDHPISLSEIALDVSPDMPDLTYSDLTDAQQKTINLIMQDIEKKAYSTTLLFGNNNQKRREIQFKLALKVLKSNRQVLLILPETSLIDEVFSIWRKALNREIAILHSKIPLKKRLELLNQIKSGKFSLVIGTRSAVFAPLDNLGLIIVEEENHPSYKEETSPYYNARDVAVVRGKIEKAIVVLSSRSPSLESFHNCQQGKYRLCRTADNEKTKPKIEIVDKRKKAAKAVLSPVIIDILKKEKKSAVMLLNRRGFSRSIICEDCGFIFRCPDCGIGLIFHRPDMALRCHYCNYQKSGIKSCPNCNGTNFTYQGFGTQKLEEVLKENIPEIKSVRLDSDVADKSGIAQKIISEFQQGGQQILFGTQMVLRGLDLSKVGLVIILSIDELLCFPDFRARERGFDFLSQIIAKIEEENPLARLVIQTSMPDDWVIRCAIRRDFVGFFQKEMQQRKELFYPPFSHLISISFSGRREQEVKKISGSLIRSLSNLIQKDGIGKTQVLGPNPVFFTKGKKQSQWQAMVKTANPVKINCLLEGLLKDKEFSADRLVKLKIEVDPSSLI